MRIFHIITLSAIVVSMNTNNINHSQQKPRKSTIIVIVVALVAIATLVYGVVAYTSPLWPFTQTTKKVETTTGNSVALDGPKVRATFEKEGDTKTLHANTDFKTTEQGDCTLVMTNPENTYTLKNSSKGIDGLTGCPEWNVSVSSAPAGKYEMDVTFISVSGKKLTAKDDIVIE